MAFIDIWRSELKTSFDLFGALAAQDRSINLPYGIVASALLWPVRAAPNDPEQKQALDSICDGQHVPHLVHALFQWDKIAPLDAAKRLAGMADTSQELHNALEGLLLYFRDDWLHEMLEPAQQSVTMGNVNAANVVGGVQYVAGSLIINYIQPKAERACPKPLAEPERFGGRETELQALSAKLKVGETTAITTAIHGLGGVGKTTLAWVLAHRLFEDGTFRAVLWGDVTRNPNALGLLGDWVKAYADSAFDIGKFTGEARERQIAAAAKVQLEEVIGERCAPCEPPRVLVVLDDVWDNGLEAARLIQSACPDGSTVLITTRSQKLANNLHANAEPLSYMNPDEAVKLLQAYLPEGDEATLRKLGEALGGHALAMELAARRIVNEAGRPGETLASVLARCTAEYQAGIPQGTPFADLKLEAGEKREDNLALALALSYEDLNDTDRAHFRALGILAYDVPFDTTLLAALWQVEQEKVDDQCDTLRLLSLIEGAPEVGQGWYRQHPLLRAYAHALLENVKETEAAFVRYTEYVIVVASIFQELPPEAWGVLEPYLAHIHRVGDELARRYREPAEPDDLLAEHMEYFAARVTTYLHMRREVQRMEWLEMGLAASRRRESPNAESLLLGTLGFLHSSFGEKAKALDYFEQALPIRRSIGDRQNEAVILNNIGGIYHDLGEKAKALDYYQQALPISRSVGDRENEAVTLNNIGGVYSALGEVQKALDYYQQALPIRSGVGDRMGEATTLNNIGMVYSTLGEVQKALTYFEQALPISRSVGDRAGEAATLNNIGGVYSTLGEVQKALDYYEQALPIRRSVGDRAGEAATLNNVGRVYRTLGELTKALDYYQQALPIMRSVGDRAGEAVTLNNIGYVYFLQGRLNETAEMLKQIIEIVRSIGAVAQEAGYLFNRAVVLQQMGEITEAVQHVEQSVAILKHHHLPMDANRATLAQHEQFLAQLRGESVPQPDEQEEAIRQLVAAYQRGGEAAVRELLKEAGLPEEAIAGLIAQLAAAVNAPSLLPTEEIKVLVNNTAAVRTFAADKRDEWRTALQTAQQEYAAQGNNWQIEVEFVEALLAVVDERPASLPEGHPYQPYLQQVLDRINSYTGD